MIDRALAPLFLLCAGGAAAAQVAVAGPDVRSVLARELRFSTSDLADLDRGRVVRHALPAASGEVAVVGAVRVGAPIEAFFARVRDIARFKSGPEVLQIGRFSSPPVADDLTPLTVDKDDFDVRECRVGDCSIRLPAAIIERIGREIDPRAPDAQARGAALFKQVLLEKVQAYAAGAPDPLPQYDDGSAPIRPREAFEAVLDRMPEIGALVPGLPDHLKRYPAGRVADAEDFVYWSKEKFGLAPFISITHVTIACPSPATCVMTTRDVYSSRYLDASVALAIAHSVGPEAFNLVYDNRSRANALKGSFGGLRRALTERRARRGLEESLQAIKKQLEKN